MTDNTTPPALVSLHRFGEHAALAILNVPGPTVYLDLKQARQLAADMARLCRSIERESYADSAYHQESVPVAMIAN